MFGLLGIYKLPLVDHMSVIYFGLFHVKVSLFATDDNRMSYELFVPHYIVHVVHLVLPSANQILYCCHSYMYFL